MSRLYGLLLVALLAMSCETPLLGHLEGGRYVDPSGEVSVEIPPVPDLGIVDGGNPTFSFVDFHVGRGYWMFPGGAYSLEWHHDWFHDGRPASTPEDYFERTEALLPAYVRLVLTGNFNLVSHLEYEVNGRPAYRFLARGERDGLAALYAGTSIWFGDRVAVALHVIEIDEEQLAEPPGNLVSWPTYDRFCASIQRLK